MTQNEKELLLKDLCARLPYGIKAQILNQENIQKDVVISVGNIPYIPVLGKGWFKECKPYLFPLSSMTNEQTLAFWKIEFKDNGGFENDWDFPLYPPKVGNHFIIEALDWLNRNHFDYRGLIEKGLAIDATNLNIY